MLCYVRIDAPLSSLAVFLFFLRKNQISRNREVSVPGQSQRGIPPRGRGGALLLLTGPDEELLTAGQRSCFGSVS